MGPWLMPNQRLPPRLPLRPAPKAGTTVTMAIPTEDTTDMEDTMEATTDIPTEDMDTGGREMLRNNNKADLLLRPRLILNTCSMDIITPPLTLIPWLTAITTPTPPLILTLMPQSLILPLLLLLNPSPTMLTQEVLCMPSLSVKPR